MTRSVDEIENIVLTVIGVIFEPYGSCLDGYSTLTLDVHIVEQLVFHLTQLDRVGQLEDTVCQRGLTVIYMCDYAKITYLVLIH